MIECVRFGNAVASLCVEREGAIPAMPVMEEAISISSWLKTQSKKDLCQTSSVPITMHPVGFFNPFIPFPAFSQNM